ncbi:hypothetical protein GGX14DRAFT_443242, partial [Mycena pura]
MPTPLAQELLEIIIGHVHDKPTLKSCALASSRLHTLSQRGHFSSMESIRISLASPSRATTSYMVVNGHFLQSPRLAGYVTTLTVEFRYDLTADALEISLDMKLKLSTGEPHSALQSSTSSSARTFSSFTSDTSPGSLRRSLPSSAPHRHWVYG